MYINLLVIGLFLVLPASIKFHIISDFQIYNKLTLNYLGMDKVGWTTTATANNNPTIHNSTCVTNSNNNNPLHSDKKRCPTVAQS